jgi:hypothetical protein
VKSWLINGLTVSLARSCWHCWTANHSSYKGTPVIRPSPSWCIALRDQQSGVFGQIHGTTLSLGDTWRTLPIAVEED